jgi:hypothetical protein
VKRRDEAQPGRYLLGMRRRLLLLDLDPAPIPRSARPTAALAGPGPLVILPLPDGRAAAALPLRDESPEEVLASLLADGVAIRGSRIIDL